MYNNNIDIINVDYDKIFLQSETHFDQDANKIVVKLYFSSNYGHLYCDQYSKNFEYKIDNFSNDKNSFDPEK